MVYNDDSQRTWGSFGYLINNTFIRGKSIMTNFSCITVESKETRKKCSVEGCNKAAKNNSCPYCLKHYTQIRKYGKVTKTIFDPNEIIINGDECYIVLTDKYMNVTAQAIIDYEDYDLVCGYKWYLNTTLGYVKSDSKTKRVFLHRLLMSAPVGLYVDHIDFNPLNNKKSNLRVCSSAQNAQHQRGLSNSSSQYKGVSYYRPSKMWRARIKYNGEQKHIGHFVTEKEAAIAYNEYAIKYHKEFCYLNEIREIA